MSLLSEKQAIRQRILAAREQLLPDDRAEYNVAITGRLLALPEYNCAGTVLGYMNFGSEFASELWVAQVLSAGKRLVLPRVNRHNNMLDLYYVDDLETQVESGLWGIREPVVARCERLIEINEVEFALLPGIAFSREGARLGYGGGFYDKLLAHVQHYTTLATAAYRLQVVQHIPQEATDVKVGWLITETETINCKLAGN
jgi:5-formyltetrahydrofolate cyclo-ligase